MSVSIKDILETISETRSFLINDYKDANDKKENYIPTAKELLKHILVIYKAGTQLDILNGILDDKNDIDFYAALLLVAAAKIDED